MKKVTAFVGSARKKNTYTGFDPKTEEQLEKIERDLTKHSQRFYTFLEKSAYPTPTFYRLMGFRMTRTLIRQIGRENDREYFADKGWFESDYYYPTNLNALKRAAGSLADRMAPEVQKLFN